MKDYLGIIGFFISVLVGALLINTFLLRSFNVSGPSMEPTLYTGDRVVVNRIHHTIATLRSDEYRPQRGDIVVFNNPYLIPGQPDEYIVKRVIGLPGERVVVEQGEITVYNNRSPEGFNPDNRFSGPKSPTSGEIDTRVPRDAIFVAGDNRISDFSLDSRNGLGTVELSLIEGPVVARVFPFTQLQLF